MKQAKNFIDNKIDKASLKFTLRKYRKDIIFWSTSFIIILLIIIFICSEDEGFFLILSSLIQLISFILLYFKIEDFQNVSGLSGNSLIIYAIVILTRLLPTLIERGYTPDDKTSLWVYELSEFFSLIVVLYLLACIYELYYETSDNEIDNKLPFYYFAIPCFILALIFKADLNDNIFTDFLWAFSMYYETFAIIPQIFLFVSKKGQIEKFTSHYVALCGLSRLFSLIYWWQVFTELDSVEDYFTGYFVKYFVLGAQILQLILMGDYYYLYFKSLFKGKQMNTLDI